MRVYIYVVEGRYQGLHGIYSQCVVEVNDLDHAEFYADDLGIELASRYDYEDDCDVENEYYYNIYKIRDDVIESVEELDRLCNKFGNEDFIEKYCERKGLE